MSLRAIAFAALSGLALVGAAQPASAQLFGRPTPEAPIAAAPDVAAMGVRIERLEGQIRALTGQLEQAQNQNRRLEDQMKRFQQDVEFRFQEIDGKGSGGQARKPAVSPAPAPVPATPAATTPQRRSAVETPPAAAPTIPPPPHAETGGVASGVKVDPGTLGPFAGKPAPRPPTAGRRGDAFDPAADPAAPGAPRPLGQTRASAPLTPAESGAASTAAGQDDIASILDEPTAGPLDLTRPRRAEPRVIPAPAGPLGSTASLPDETPRGRYDEGLAAFRAGRYEAAETALRAFLEDNPNDRRASDAYFYRGEAYLQRGRHADAAEQYLKVTTDFAASGRAPDAMLKLGMTLAAMGAKEQACATFGELPRKHPRATGAIRGAERELKRNSC